MMYLKKLTTKKNSAQTTLEYVMVVTVVAAALIATYSTLNYLVRGRFQVIADYVADDND